MPRRTPVKVDDEPHFKSSFRRRKGEICSILEHGVQFLGFIHNVMPTLQEHLDDLDRMVDGGADKPKIRHQIDLIGRIVATNEAEHSRLVPGALPSRSW